MREISQLVLMAWIPLALAVFYVLPARVAVLFMTLVGMMFLPVDEIPVPGFVDLNKVSVISCSCLLGVAVRDTQRLLNFRPTMWDVPILLFCLGPAVSSLVNGYGPYMATSKTIDMAMQFGLMYLMGRLYCSSPAGQRQLVAGIMIAGLIYAPLCWYEMRMAPQLHNTLYGFHPSSFAQTIRGGGWRPVVFIGHGLSLSFWMATAAIVMIYHWYTGTVRSVLHIRASVAAVALFLTVVMCRSTGATLLMLIAIAALAEWHFARTRMILWMLLIISVVYLPSRIFGIWHGDDLVALARTISDERADSLAYRLNHESLLIDSMGDRMWTGRGPVDFNFVINDRGQREWVVGDSVWINYLTLGGAMVPLMLWAAIAIPAFRALRTIRSQQWLTSANVSAAALAVVVLIFLVDSIANATVSAVNLMAMGALTGIGSSESRQG